MQNKLDTGIKSLILVANYYDLQCDYHQIKHNYVFEREEITKMNLVRAAKEVGLKSRLISFNFKRLKKVNLPAIVYLEGNGYVVLTSINDNQTKYFDINEMKELSIETKDFVNNWDKDVMLFTYREKTKKERKFSFKWFLDIILNFKKSLNEVLISSLLLQLLGLVSPAIMQIIIDKVLVHNTKSTLWIIAICLVATIFFEWILGITRMLVFSHMTSRVDILFNSKLFSHLYNLPIKYFEDRKTGEITNRIRETEKIRSFLTGTPIATIIDLVFIVIYLIIMFCYSSKLSLQVLLILPIFILLSAIVTPLFKNSVKTRFDKNSELTAFLVESISGINTLKSLAVENIFEKRWENKMANYASASYQTKNLSNVTSAIGEVIQKLLNLLILWTGTKEVLKGNLSVGAFIAFRMYSSHIIMPIIRTLQLWQTLQQTSVAVENLKDIFEKEPEVKLGKTKTILPDLKGDITFENVTFKYNDEGQEILKNISFGINQGTTLGIIGKSGSGKSTISKLLQKLYKTNKGKVIIDGIDTTLVDPSWIRRQIGVVLQDNYLFNDTIRNNIDISNKGYSMEEIIEASKLAGAHEFISEFENSYETIVGEKGSMLSGGQKQRIAIARALVSNPKILIFDEATSALDYESESIIQKNMKEIMKGRTVVIIAHRMSTLRDVDCILSLEKGEIVEFGTKEELLKNKGLYSYMCMQQMG